MGTIGYKITFKDKDNGAFDIYSDNTYNNEFPPSTAEKKGCKAVVESLDFKNMIYNHCHVKAQMDFEDFDISTIDKWNENSIWAVKNRDDSDENIRQKEAMLERAKTAINNSIDTIFEKIKNDFNALHITVDDDRKDDFVAKLKKEIKEKKIKLSSLGFELTTRAKILYDYITNAGGEIQNLVNSIDTSGKKNIPFTINQISGDIFKVDDIVKADHSQHFRMFHDKIEAKKFWPKWAINVDVCDWHNENQVWSPYLYKRWRPTGGITLSSDVAKMSTLVDETGTFDSKKKTNISEEEMVKDFKTFLVQMAMETKQATSTINAFSLLKIT